MTSNPWLWQWYSGNVFASRPWVRIPLPEKDENKSKEPGKG